MASLSYDEAAHLLRRAGFGGTPDEINLLSSLGREGAVDYLINFGQINNQALDDLIAKSFDFSNPSDNTKFNQNELRRWWFTRMTNTARQFEEKMTLFWHNHFATSINKVNEINGLYMYNQNKLFRDNALAKFDDLLLKVSQDAAMLLWLDNVTNVLGKPNENFARELQELFTMGINDVVTGEQNYTEQDVKEIARAFTGWNFRRSSPYDFQMNSSQHDNATKTIYGQQANFSGQDVITLVSGRQSTARFLTSKLFEFFVYPMTSSSDDKSTIDRFAKVYLNNNHSIKELVRAIFASDEFYSDRAFFSLVKQPVEFIVGAIRMLGGTYNPGTLASRGDSLRLANSSRNMGQDIFAPPDVSGWHLNLGWVDTASMLERFNFANSFATNRNATNPGAFITNDQLKSLTKGNGKKTARKFLTRVGPLDVGDAFATLRTYLEAGDNGQPAGFTNDDATVNKKVRGLVHLIMCLPEFQLN